MRIHSANKKYPVKRRLVTVVIGLLLLVFLGLILIQDRSEQKLRFTATALAKPVQLESKNSDKQVVVERVELELKGLVIKDGQNSALVSINDEPALIVKVGDVLSNGLRVEQISTKNIIVRHTQVLERVRLLSKHQTDSKTPTANTIERIVAETNSADDSIIFRVENAQLGKSKAPEGIEKIADNQYIVKRSYITGLLDSGELIKQALIDYQDGKGYRFGSIKPGGAFDHLGFNIGDVISEVNGKPITSFRDALGIGSDINNVAQLQIRISRNNNPVYLHYFLE